METLMKILTELRPDLNFEKEKKLIDDGILDSFDLVNLIGELNEAFEIDISFDYLEPENFNNPEDMYKMIIKLQNEDN